MLNGGGVRGRGDVVAPGIGTTVDEGGAGIQGGERRRTFRWLLSVSNPIYIRYSCILRMVCKQLSGVSRG